LRCKRDGQCRLRDSRHLPSFYIYSFGFFFVCILKYKIQWVAPRDSPLNLLNYIGENECLCNIMKRGYRNNEMRVGALEKTVEEVGNTGFYCCRCQAESEKFTKYVQPGNPKNWKITQIWNGPWRPLHSVIKMVSPHGYVQEEDEGQKDRHKVSW
jgi:hypothetical protein